MAFYNSCQNYHNLINSAVVRCEICCDKDAILCYYHQNPQHVILNGTKWSEESLLHIMRSFASLRMTGYHDLFHRAVVKEIDY